MSLRRGIEPIIATVILVAVALVIAAAVVGYLMGLFGGLTGGNPQISVTNVVLRQSGALELYVNNAGAGSDRLLKIEAISGGSLIGSWTGSITITGNLKTWITTTLSGSGFGTAGTTGTAGVVSVGDAVILKLYFEKSGTQTINVVVSP